MEGESLLSVYLLPLFFYSEHVYYFYFLNRTEKELPYWGKVKPGQYSMKGKNVN